MSDSGEPSIPDAGSSRTSEPPGLNCSRTSRTQTKCWHCDADCAHRICFGCMRAMYCQKCGWKAAGGHRAECLQWAVNKNCWYCDKAGAECKCVACDKARYCDPDCREKGKAQHSPKHCRMIGRRQAVAAGNSAANPDGLVKCFLGSLWDHINDNQCKAYFKDCGA